MLSVACPHCTKAFRVPPDWAGRSAKCKNCQSKFQIPSDSAADIPAVTESKTQSLPAVKPVQTSIENTDRKWTRAELLAALPESVEPVRVSFGYLMALAFVAAVLVLLPVLYLGLTLLVAYGVYWHFTNGGWILQVLDGKNVHGKGALLVILAWLAPGVIGGILVLFMFKPLLNWRRRYGNRPTLTRDDEPLLYEYVDNLCDALGAPRPVRIDYDHMVNASASFASHWSFFTNSLVLTLGLPIVDGLTLRELTGVMAHEFGHFSQFWAMRLGRIIEMVNDWFQRVVEERDEWDMKLEAYASEMDIRLGWVLYLAMFFVWLVRRILNVLRYIGLFFSRRLSRQMEFDADSYEVRVSGRESFAETFDRIGILMFASQAADSAADQFLREGKVIDDYPKFVSFQATELPQEKMRPILDAVRNRKAPWSSTHPSDAERIAAAERFDASSPFTVDAPAKVLFRDFTRLSREFTRRSYSRKDGAEVKLEDLTSVDELIVEQKLRRQRYEAARRFVFNADLALIRWGKDRDDLTMDATDDDLRAELRAARQTMVAELPAYREAAQEWTEVGRAANELFAVRLSVAFGTPADFRQQALIGQRIKTTDQLNKAFESIGARYTALRPRLEPFENACALRLRRAVILAHRALTGKEAGDLQRVWSAFRLMADVSLLMEDHEPTLQQFEWLFERLMKRPNDDDARQVLIKIKKKGLDEMQQCWGHLSQVPYPFDLPYETDHLSRGLLPYLEDEKNPAAVYHDLRRFASGYWALYRRTLGFLAEVAERTETREGFETVVVPAPEA